MLCNSNTAQEHAAAGRSGHLHPQRTTSSPAVPYNLKVTNTPTRARFIWKFDMSKPNTAILLLLSLYVRRSDVLNFPVRIRLLTSKPTARSCLVLRSGFRLQVRTYPVGFWCC